jgi:hypothetical protein
MKKIEKISLKNETKIKTLKGFDVLELGFQKNLKGGCGATDHDNMCFKWCSSYSCQHDGVCGSGYFDF